MTGASPVVNMLSRGQHEMLCLARGVWDNCITGHRLKTVQDEGSMANQFVDMGGRGL